MQRRRITSYALIAGAALVLGCSGGSEKKVLDDFFRASRLRDNVTLGNFATATFDPRTDGVVQDFDVVSISDERKTPLPLKQYAKALQDARAEDEAFTTERRAYRNANINDINRVLRLDASKKPLSAKDMAVKTTWDKWTTDGQTHNKAVSDAQQQLASGRGLAELSLTRAGRDPVDVTKYDCELLAKDVTVNATVRTPNGQTVSKPLKIGLRRARMQVDHARDTLGRWIVTSISAP